MSADDGQDGQGQSYTPIPIHPAFHIPLRQAQLHRFVCQYVLTRFKPGLFTPKQVAGKVAAMVLLCSQCKREVPTPLLARGRNLKRKGKAAIQSHVGRMKVA